MATPAPDQDKTARIESGAYETTPSPRGGDAQFAPGTIIAARYRIAGILGSGGMGEVYRADDMKLGQQVALKFLPARLARDATLLERLHDEVRLGRQIAHPNVCRIYDIIDWENAHFVAMEYVDGEDLSRLLRRIGRLANDKAVEIARGIASGLSAAHAKGILHRDLKPANVMIDSHGEARIMDFGLALAAGDDSQDGVISGTPAYMAPEQLAGEPATVQSELYALGLVMYELFTGKRAHNARTLPERVRDLDSEITTPSNVIRDIDPAVERVILRCLSHDPLQRPRSAREVIAALPGGDPLAAAMAAGETPSPRFIAAAPIAGSLRPAVAWSLLGGIVAVAALLIAIAVLGRPLQRFGLTKPPEVQLERGRELLRALGIPAREFSAHGYSWKPLYYQWLQRDDTPRNWERLRRGYPLVTFWMREQNAPMLNPDPRGTPQPWKNEPPLTEPGASVIELDSRGNLFSLRAIASPQWPARTLNWNALLAAAALSADSLTRAEPDQLPPSFADARAAWNGKDENGALIHIDAAMFRGVPVFFEIKAPWDSGDASSMDFGPRFQFVITSVMGTALTIGVVLAWRNLRRRRGDRQGALRLGAAVFVFSSLQQLLVADHEVAPLHEMSIVIVAIGAALMRATLICLVYLAVEPYLRRRWPDRLVSWARLLGGNWHDPMVGRDVLIGLLGGFLHTAIIFGAGMARELVRHGQLPPEGGNPNFLGSSMLAISQVPGSGVWAIFFALATMVALMVLTIALRRRSFGVAAFFALYFCIYLAGSTDLWSMPALVLLTALITFVVARYGLLAAAAFQAGFVLTFFGALPDAIDWYTPRTLIPLASALALAIWAFRTSLGNQSPFGASRLLED